MIYLPKPVLFMVYLVVRIVKNFAFYIQNLAHASDANVPLRDKNIRLNNYLRLKVSNNNIFI